MPLEDLINGKVADMFRLAGLPNVEAEETHGRKRHDIRVRLDDGLVILEAAIGSRRGAIVDADRRLAQNATVLAFAVCYEDGQRYEDVTLDTPLSWTLRTRDATSGKAREGVAGDRDWTRGDVRQLAEAVRVAPQQHIDGADMAAGQLLIALDKAAKDIPPATRQRLADVLTLPEPKGDKPSERDPEYFKRAKRAALVLATSMLFQHRLDQNIVPGWRNPTECARDDDPVSAFRDVWDAILAIDYQPIFQTAQLALSALPAMPDTNRLVRELAFDVGLVARHTAGKRHDLLGRVFHRVLDTARYDGSFYTSSAAATLLAALALPRALKDEWDHDAIEKMRVCDPSCGTGTLLMATVERLNQLKRGDTELDAELDELLAEALVEKVIYGYDTNLTATHMTASTLGMIRPQTQFDQMHVNQTPFGVFDDPDGGGKKVARVGSLEFLHGDGMLLKPWPSARNAGGEQWMREPPPPMDLVIMNPPFTRDSLRHDQMGPDAERAVKDREGLLLGNDRRTASLRSSSSMFVVLGTKIIGDEGTLAIVLPSANITGPEGLPLRQYLAESLYIDTVVSSHDTKRIFFSENTGISEVLIICRRWNGNGEKPQTKFVNLSRNPATSYEAHNLAGMLENNEGGEFTVQRVDAGRVASGDWYAVNFYAPWLGSAYREMAAGLVRLDAIADIGPTGRRIRDTYRKFALSQPTHSGRRALWHHKTDVTRSMSAQTDVYMEPKIGKEHLADKYWEQRGRLLLPNKVRLNTARVGAVIVEMPALGSRWVPCRPYDGDDAMEDAICAWLNSSPGILAMYGERDSHTLSRPSFSLETHRSLPVPDFPALSEARDALAAAYEELKDQQLRPLPEMARDPVRMRLDDIVGDALGFDREHVARIRKALGEEPSITNRPLYADAEAKQAGLL